MRAAGLPEQETGQNPNRSQDLNQNPNQSQSQSQSQNQGKGGSDLISATRAVC